MRPIDADALKELFSEVIGSIAKKPEMNGNLEHMIRASAMVIQMIDDAPTVQPDTNCSEIPNNSDTISRQAAIDALNEYFVRIGKLKRRGLNKGEKAIRLDTVGAINSLPPAQTELIEKAAYIRGFEQGRTQGMIDAQGGKK